MLGCKSLWNARCTIAGMEVMHALRKGQLVTSRPKSQTPAEQFSAVAASITHSAQSSLSLSQNCDTTLLLCHVAYAGVELQLNRSGKCLFLRFPGSLTSQMR
jgi:hypothetical protein